MKKIIFLMIFRQAQTSFDVSEGTILNKIFREANVI